MWIAAGLVLVCALLAAPGCRRRRGSMAPLFAGTGPHWRRLYGRRGLLKLGAALAGAGVLVYSGLDAAATGWHDRRVRSAGSDRVARVGYEAGKRPWFLLWAALAAVDAWVRSGPFTRWGRANFEAMCVGLPLLWTVQRGLGADRPDAAEPTPAWRPLRTDHAASGHAFIGAVPWLNAARAAVPGPVRPLLVAGSLLSGWSRLNDRKHYLSLVWLGWFLAWQATAAVAAARPAAGTEAGGGPAAPGTAGPAPAGAGVTKETP